MTAEEILLTFPEFNPAPANQATYVTLADDLTADSSTWNDDDDLRAYAVALRAAHMMVRVGLGSSSAAAPGPVFSKKIGDLSVTYAIPQGGSLGQSDLLMTSYGRTLMELQKSVIMSPITSYG